MLGMDTRVTGGRAARFLGRLGWRSPLVVLATAISVVANTLPAQAGGGTGNASITLTKTVAGTSVSPNLALSFTVDKASAIPGDRLTYTATVSNTGATLTLTGAFHAQNSPDVASTVADYYDEVEYYTSSTKVWTALAGVQAHLSGYTPIVPSPVLTGMTLTAVQINASGVTYPTSGDPILGTQMAISAVAGWNYTAVLPLSLSQIATLSNPAKVSAIRNVVHFEVTPRPASQGEPFIFRQDFTDPFLSQQAAATNVVVTITVPSGTQVQFNSSTTPGLVSLGAGASVAVSTVFSVPVVAAKGTASDAAYFAALALIEGSLLKATATATGSSTGGSVSATPPPPATTIEHLPIASILKGGPSTVAAGAAETNPLTLNNTGGATASALSVVDSVPSGGSATVSGVPATLAPGATATASALFPVPSAQPSGSLTDTATLTWQDANGNAYGPVSSSFTTTVNNNLSGASLTLGPATTGPDVVGTNQAFTATLLDHNGVPVAGQAVTLSITGANPTSLVATTAADGTAQFAYGGTHSGTDQVQAGVTSGTLTLQSNTVTVSWIVPIVPASTTEVNGLFFPATCQCFAATPGMTPFFAQQFPTININPPTGSVPHMPPSIGSFNRPMVSVSTDTVGNFTGATVVQGTDANGVLHQAGVGDMFEFQSVFTGSLTVAKAGQLTFSFYSDDGFIFGLGGGATRVSGVLANPPASGLTAFQGYPVMGSFNQPTGPSERDVIVSFPAPGLYAYEMDYFECCADGLAFTVGIAGAAGMPPTGNLALSPYILSASPVGQPVSVNVAAMDASGVAMPNLTVNLDITGANPQQLPATTDSTGFATFTYAGANAGVDQLRASAQVSGLPEISNAVNMSWTPAPPPPTISTPSPDDGAIVKVPTAINATIVPPAGQTIASWAVTYQALDPGSVIPLSSGTGAPPTPLATLDPTLLPNDAYAITITATASGGGVQTATTTVIVFGYLKPGRYVTTYQDLNVPAFGFQMQVRRTYDSFDKSQGDFGIGWRVSLNNFRLSTNRQLGAGGWTQYNTQCALGLCLTAYRNTAPRFVTIVFPDQHTEIFDFSAVGGSNIFFTGAPKYTPRAGTGTTSTLTALGADTTIGYQDDGNLYNGNGQTYDPQQFKLTLLDGTVLILDRTRGLVSMTNRDGEFITVSAAGITARSGQGIVFTRDGSGRITQITDPAGHYLNYHYSTAGDLDAFTDADGNVTAFSYDSAHNLMKAFGPAGQPLQADLYDASGRLISITDANGNTAQITTNVAGRQETVVDPTGLLSTVFTLDDLGDVVRQDQVFDGKTLTTTATYDEAGRPLTRTDPLGHKWSATYDSNGNLLSVADPLNHAVGVTYDSFGAPLTFTDPAGNVSSYGYDASGNLVSFSNALGQVDHYGYNGGSFVANHTDALGRTTSYNPDGAGNVNAIRDPLGHGPTYSYDAQGHMTSSVDGAGNVTTYAYDPAGNLVSTKDALGHTTTLTYNALNELVSRTDALGKTTTYAYDGNRALTSATDPLGNVTSYTYDAAGRESTVTDPAGGVTIYTYDGAGRLAAEKDPVGHLTSYMYDNAGRLITKTMPNGGVFTYAYDDAGHQASVTDPLGHATSYGYDADGRLNSTTDPLGNKTTYVLDALGRQVKVIDALGQSTQHSYDVAGQLVSDTDALSKVTSYGYDAASNRTSVTDPLGHTTTYQYDQDNRVNEVIDPLNRFVIYNFDALSRVTSTRLFSGIFTGTIFDAVGHVTATSDGLNTTAYAYDAAGRQVSMTDPRGNTTSYGYDAVGRQTTITDALGGKVTTAYDAAGQKTSTTNPRGDTTNFTYDSLGDLLTQTDPAGGVTSYAYDLVGRQTSKTDARGVAVTNTYDAGDRLTGISFPGGSIGFVYDALGRRTSMTDPTGTTGYAYDGDSRLTSVAAPQGAVGYSYDAAGNRTSMSVPGRGLITYGYDAANQLSQLTDWAGQSFSFTYSADGLPASVNRPNGVVTNYSYDGADRLTAVHHDGPSGTIAHFDYTLDGNGNRTSMTTAAGTESYTLDALNRLTGVKYANGDTGSYSYDAAGNRLTSTLNGATTNYSYDAAGRLVSAGANSLTYDAAGNVLTNGSSSFTWDWAGRLATANVGGIASSYTYDGDGIRVASTIAGSTTNYVWDRAASLPLLIDDGTQGYVQTDLGLLEQLGSIAGYPLSDALGSVRDLASQTASIAGTTTYDAFGQVRSQSGQQSSFGFTGQQTDITGMSYLRARYYNPSTGSFLSPDGVQPNAPGTQGYNPYSYAANNPISATDPSGQNLIDLAINTIKDRWAQAALVGLGVALTFALLNLSRTLECAVQVPRSPLCPDTTGAAPPDFVKAWQDTVARVPRPDPGPSLRAIAAGVAAVIAAAVAVGESLNSICPASGQPVPAFRIFGVPVLCVYEHLSWGIFKNDVIALGTGYPGLPPRALHYEPNKRAQAQNYRQAMKGEPLCSAVDGVDQSRDEYPYKTTKEGGLYQLRKARVECVPVPEQNAQGVYLSIFYQNELGLLDNAPFFVFPVPY